MTGPNTQQSGDQIRNTLSVIMRVKSALLAIVALVVGGLCWVVLHLVRTIAADQEVVLPTFAAWWLEHPFTIVFVAIPAVILAISGAVAHRGMWAWLILTLLCMLIPVVIVLYCFLIVVGTLYRYEPL